MNNQKVKARVFIAGRVQGVFFRKKTYQKAKKFGIAGWIRNLLDGRVEAIFEGEQEKVGKIIKWAKRGPFFAEVKKLDVEWQEFNNEFENFEIRFSPR